jgi:tRNA-(ms[2]io[6]A)-hydroxylase
MTPMLTTAKTDIERVHDFIKRASPEAWIQCALQNIPLLLIDHAHCERKAATTALHLMGKYAEKDELVNMLSALAREELLHFEKVLILLKQRGIRFGSLKPSNYAQTLHQHVSNDDYIERMVDHLIVAALIEARSCERFACLVARLDDRPLAKFYASLVKAEARHFENYLRLAERYWGGSINLRLNAFIQLENTLICAQDKNFRFLGGVPPMA